jgi:hypothetical protein
MKADTKQSASLRETAHEVFTTGSKQTCFIQLSFKLRSRWISHEQGSWVLGASEYLLHQKMHWPPQRAPRGRWLPPRLSAGLLVD